MKNLNEKVKKTMKPSKSAEKQRLKEERISKLGKSLLQEQMRTNPEFRSEFNVVREMNKNNKSLSEKDLGIKTVERMKRRQWLQSLEDNTKRANEDFDRKLEQIKKRDKRSFDSVKK